MQSAARILGLLDDKAGHANQVRGVIDALSGSTKCIALHYNTWAALPNMLLGATMCHLTRDCREAISALSPDMVIACGRRTEPVARAIKRAHPKTKIVYIMSPSRMDGLDCVIAPEHDNACAQDARIIKTLGPLHRVKPVLLEEARAEWAERFSALPHPRVGVLIGDVSVSEAHIIMARACMLAGENGSLLISNSRRTMKGLLHGMLRELNISNYAFDVHNPQSAKTSENPYVGILACADTLIVSGDSLSMCVEACATHKPVYIATGDTLPNKHRALHRVLFERGYAKSLLHAEEGYWHPAPMPSETERVANLLQI